jgi:Gp157 protein
MRSLTLYQMSSEYEFLSEDLYDYETGVVNETALARLNELEDSMENKCINITRLFRSIEATQEAIKAEKDRMAKNEKALKNQVERLKDYLLSNMDRCDIKKIECPQFTINLQKNPPSVVVDDESLIPVTYDKFKIEKDMTKIREDLKNGIDIPGVRLVQGKSIRIR